MKLREPKLLMCVQYNGGQRLGECRRPMHRNLFMKPAHGQSIVRLLTHVRPSDGDHVPVDPAPSERALSLHLSARPSTRGESNCHVLHFEPSLFTNSLPPTPTPVTGL